jgi:hypothetical protein
MVMMTAARDPALGSVENPVVTVTHGLGSQGCRVGSRFRLGKRKRTKNFSARHCRKKSFLLLIGPEPENHLRGKRVVYTHQHRSGCIDNGDFFESDEISGSIEPEPVEFLGYEHPEKSKVTHLFYDGRLEVRPLIPVRYERRDLVASELARKIANRSLVVSKVE